MHWTCCDVCGASATDYVLRRSGIEMCSESGDKNSGMTVVHHFPALRGLSLLSDASRGSCLGRGTSQILVSGIRSCPLSLLQLKNRDQFASGFLTHLSRSWPRKVVQD
ncbi:hypothetical protein SCLCIDRAFT_238126 [Scleroderma citrinum Foug A]|uniref:Uncharacterized protein n=1 Tax=Scleroderma citrinum Foug A TaxID=1036808 RepID=A0A0C3D731_9AGAM|nr:hypothetical protein SCLCIDRAFT_238126 [Scleroderma citrinum Foug A]